MNKELSKCCEKCGCKKDGQVYRTCANFKCPCHQSPHQEPVATQKKCNCGEPHISSRICHHYDAPCHVKDENYTCSHLHSPTQEPMEWWIKEFDTIFVRDDGLMNKYTYDTLGNPQNTASAVKIFISKVIKQAEERHNQDCTREEWAREILNEIEKYIVSAKAIKVNKQQADFVYWYDIKLAIKRFITNQ